MQEWVVEGWLYIVLMSVAIGIVLGYGSMFAIRFSLRRYVLSLPISERRLLILHRRKWIDNESLLLWPTALGVSLGRGKWALDVRTG